MAIYHLSAKQPISRTAGRSVVGAAAYRAGAKITDERTGVVHDYSRRRGVFSARLVLPGVGALVDRSSFWNAIEQHHRRKDAVVAREVVIALPVELRSEAREALAWQLAKEIAERYEVAVDCAVHAPSKPQSDDRNWHAHLLMSACHVDATGTPGLKAAPLDPILCRRARIEDSVAWLRPRWQNLVNAALAAAGSVSRITHQSHRALGRIDHPTTHVGIGPGARARRRLNERRKAKNQQLRGVGSAMSTLIEEKRQLMRLGSKRQASQRWSPTREEKAAKFLVRK